MLAAEQIEKENCYENLGINTGNENRGEKSEIKKYFKAKFLNMWTIWGYKDNPIFVRIFVGYSLGSHKRVGHDLSTKAPQEREGLPEQPLSSAQILECKEEPDYRLQKIQRLRV